MLGTGGRERERNCIPPDGVSSQWDHPVTSLSNKPLDGASIKGLILSMLRFAKNTVSMKPSRVTW